MTDHVVIVDDDKLVADTLKVIFEREGFRAAAAYSADEGLRLVRELRPRLLVCDVTMPEKSGLELVDDVTAEMPECRVMVLTGFLSNLVKADERIRKSPHTVRVMSKPCAPEDLMRAVGAMLRQGATPGQIVAA